LKYIAIAWIKEDDVGKKKADLPKRPRDIGETRSISSAQRSLLSSFYVFNMTCETVVADIRLKGTPVTTNTLDPVKVFFKGHLT